MACKKTDFIKRRRSIRQYFPKKVELNKILKILDVAAHAPSAHNAQPWRYIIIDKPNTKRILSEAMAEEWDKDLRSDGIDSKLRRKLTTDSINLFKNSPVIIIACVSMKDMIKYPDEKRQSLEYLLAIQSVAASIQNLLLQASIEGLGAAWYCAPLFCQETVQNILGLPENIHPQALIAIGYPAEDPSPPPRFNLNEIVYYNRWGGSL
ncbi:nitroreductase family protein [[Eubacterium] cellulosolvens]